MKVEISDKLQQEIEDCIKNNQSDPMYLLEEINEAIKAEKQAYEDYFDDLVNGIGEQV